MEERKIIPENERQEMYVYKPEFKDQEKFPIIKTYTGGKTKVEADAQILAEDSIEQEQTSNLNESLPKKIVETSISQIEYPAFTLDMIPGGCFLVARRIFKSEIWLKHPFYLKTWLWIFGQANHADYKKDNRIYKRGELITSYDEVVKGVAYHYRHRLVFPTIQQIRDILKWLKSKEMIIVEPLYRNGSLAQEIVRETTGLGTDRKNRPQKEEIKQTEKTYLGIKIIVINYDTYQTLGNYERTGGKNRPQKREKEQGEKTGGFSEKQHNNKNDTRKEDNIYSQNFLNYWKEYPNKAAKKKAQEVWKKLEKREDMEALLPTLLDAIENQKKAKEIKKTNCEFVPEWPHGATWLNGRRWEDEIEVKQGYDGF